MTSIKQVYLPKQKKEYGRFVRTPFHTPCPARYSVLHLLGVLSGGDEPPFTQGSLWFVRPESPSAFPRKHCFCGHKSKAPSKAGDNLRFFCNLFQSINKRLITRIGTQNGNFIINFQPFKQRLRTIAVRLHDPSATRVSAKNW